MQQAQPRFQTEAVTHTGNAPVAPPRGCLLSQDNMSLYQPCWLILSPPIMKRQVVMFASLVTRSILLLVHKKETFLAFSVHYSTQETILVIYEN